MPNPYDRLTPELLTRAQFHKSRRSDNSGSCVEVATNLADTHGLVLVRDSKNPDHAVLAFTIDEWRAFTGGVADGEFGL